MSAADERLRAGHALMRSGAIAQASECFAEAARLDPNVLEAVANHGITLAQLGRHAEAEAPLRAALALDAACEPVLATLAGALQALGRSEEAAACAQRATALAPASLEGWTNFGAALHSLGRLTAAEQAYRRVLALAPGFAMARYNLSHVVADQWRLDEALPGFAAAIEGDPRYAPGWHAWLFHLLYDPAQTEASLFEAHRRWGERVSRLAQRRRAGERRPGRIRVGYLSPDFRTHSCAWFLRPLFAAHDRGAFEVSAWSGTRHADATTGWLRAHVEHWRDTRGMTDEALAAAIAADGVDILVDLGGHTLDQRIEVFALRPAPVQVAWLGYPATSGLAEMDFRLTDAVADPPGDADRWHSERLVRLERGFLCYAPPDRTPAVTPAPCTGTDEITFGSFNNIAKINERVIAAWSAILRAVPRSRLLLKGRLLTFAEARARILAAFAAHGIAPGRIGLREWLPRASYSLGVYADVDIALDTFPYNGTTTTFEALWMGVPVVTLGGERHAARVGASVLTHLGRSEWIARDVDAYVAIAQRLAADTAALGRLRAQLRDELARASLTDAQDFAHRVESAYRTMLVSVDDPER